MIKYKSMSKFLEFDIIIPDRDWSNGPFNFNILSALVDSHHLACPVSKLLVYLLHQSACQTLWIDVRLRD